MQGAQQDDWQELADDPEVRIDGVVDPCVEEAYWQSVYWSQPYYRSECDYEDYAPAYCVGYTGFAQYGGRFEDAEKSLCANWVRIKGDSRLTIDEAMQAIQAAWEHAATGQVSIDEEEEELVGMDQLAASAARRARQRQYAAA